MPAEKLGPAGLDVAHDSQKLRAERMILPIDLPVGAEDVRDLDRRPPRRRHIGNRRGRRVSVHATLLGFTHLTRFERIERALH